MMKRIIIISDKKEEIAESFVFFSIETILVSADLFDDSIVDGNAVVLAAVDGCTNEAFEYCVELSRVKGGIICGFADVLSDAVKEALRSCGIAFFVEREKLASNPGLLRVLFSKDSQKGTAVLIDNDRTRKDLCQSLFNSFGYEINCISSPDDLYLIKTDPAFIIHNLSLKDADLITFVKKGSGSHLFRSVPYIAFKSGGEGVSLNEINAGIGRLTSFILSEDEVWSVVVFNLFRKELYSGTDLFMRTIRMHENTNIAKDPLKQIFFSKETNFFTSPNKGVVKSLISSSEKLSKISDSLDLIHFFEWLICDQPKQTLISTGV